MQDPGKTAMRRISLWRKIKLLRKTFFTRFWGVHYAQFGEDIILGELLKKEKADGFYVDVGCYHPKKYSNTYALYKKGWRGINIDLEADKISAFQFARPDDHNVLCAVSDQRGEVTLYRYGGYGLGTTISNDYAARSGEKPLETTMIEARSLNEIIGASPYNGRPIDVLSIDVEGMDFQLLSSLDFNTYQPKIIIIEDHHRRIDDVLKTAAYKLLRKR